MQVPFLYFMFNTHSVFELRVNSQLGTPRTIFRLPQPPHSSKQAKTSAGALPEEEHSPRQRRSSSMDNKKTQGSSHTTWAPELPLPLCWDFPAFDFSFNLLLLLMLLFCLSGTRHRRYATASSVNAGAPSSARCRARTLFTLQHQFRRLPKGPPPRLQLNPSRPGTDRTQRPRPNAEAPVTEHSAPSLVAVVFCGRCRCELNTASHCTLSIHRWLEFWAHFDVQR